MSFQSNNTDYAIVTENEISSILSHFEDDIIVDIVRENLPNNFREYSTNLSNIVYAIEQNFKTTMEQYQYDKRILEKRSEVYYTIIDEIIRYYNLQYGAGSDEYTCALQLYRFFVSNFSETITSFLTNYIIINTDDLYNTLKIDNKVKDSSIIYSKKLYKTNSKLAIIHACLNDVIDNICQLDFDLNMIIDIAYTGNARDSIFLKSIIIEGESNFFRNHMIPYINYYKPIIVTNIRLELQKIFIR